MGWPTELVTLDPSKMKVDVTKNVKTYQYPNENSIIQKYNPVQVWHVKGMSTDGIMGMSPISYACRPLKLSIAAEKHGIAYYENGTRTSGIAKHPGRLSEPARQNLQKSINAGLSGENKFKAFVFEEGLDWVNIGLSNEDSQYLQTRQFQIEDISRIYRVPGVLINHPDKTATYASAEQFFLSFVVHTIRPWLARIETSINMSLIPTEDQDRIFAEFKVD
ncbi:phage portal protein, partial [Candidatus Saccharibacteria bacterium]|nr:phage portal protein [Candidatus Saccharibacteria bacterium]NIW78254.1 phage portal protein [Calditrichia bacterium]